MKTTLDTIGRLALLATILPAVLYLFGKIDLASTKNAMLAATVVWFIVAPLAQRLHPEGKS